MSKEERDYLIEAGVNAAKLAARKGFDPRGEVAKAMLRPAFTMLDEAQLLVVQEGWDDVCAFLNAPDAGPDPDLF